MLYIILREGKPGISLSGGRWGRYAPAEVVTDVLECPTSHRSFSCPPRP